MEDPYYYMKQTIGELSAGTFYSIEELGEQLDFLAQANIAVRANYLPEGANISDKIAMAKAAPAKRGPGRPRKAAYETREMKVV
jgi:hypothetical protein